RQGVAQDLPHLILHGTAVLCSTHTQPLLELIIQIANRHCRHGISPLCNDCILSIACIRSNCLPVMCRMQAAACYAPNSAIDRNTRESGYLAVIAVHVSLSFPSPIGVGDDVPSRE